MTATVLRAAFAQTEPNSPSALAFREVSKSFSAVRVLDRVSLEVHAGEVHMLLGENGAGKSTLMKVLCGAHQPDEGEILFDGRPAKMHSPADAASHGVAVVFQEFSLVPYLTVAQNIFLSREPLRRQLPFLVDHARLHRDARILLDRVGADIDTYAKVVDLPVAQQQLVEIAKALSQDARILVMDEPTAALSDHEREKLFDIVARLKRDGTAIIYVTHRMDEVFRLGDRITVLRDGSVVQTLLPRDTDQSRLVDLMVGRSIDQAFARRFRSTQTAETILEIRDLRTSTGVVCERLEVRAGEIVGLAGLVGSGRTEIARAVFGADPIESGEITVLGQRAVGRPDRMSDRGVALIPEDRKQQGLAVTHQVKDNILSASLRRLFPHGWYSEPKGRRIAEEIVSRLKIATPGIVAPARALSGGNQQKVVLGKWLARGARLFIFDEPTRGIDVRAKSEIYALLDELVAQGAAVLLVSSELLEIIQLCDRTYVMRERALVGHLPRDQFSEAAILRLAMQGG